MVSSLLEGRWVIQRVDASESGHIFGFPLDEDQGFVRIREDTHNGREEGSKIQAETP